MAVNLKATAHLRTGPYIAGLEKMKAATANLNSAAVAGSAKVVSATDNEVASRERASRTLLNQNRQIAAAANKAATAQARISSAQGNTAGLAAQRYLYADMAQMAAKAAAGAALVPIAAVAAGVAWEKNFADVIRTADPALAASEASVEQLRISLRSLVQTMPASWGDVTEIATLANQMGIASSQTVAFTNAVAMFSATSGVSVDTTATAFGRLNSIVTLSEGGFAGLADSILKVGVNSVATEGEIINIVTQISSIAGAAQMTDKEMIGLAGAMASVRIPPELSRGVVTRVFGQISRAVTDGGASLSGFAKIAGMSSDEFRASWGTEGQTGKAFLGFVEGLRKLGPQAEAELRGLGITSVRDVPVMLRLARASDSEGNVGGLLRQTMEDAENAAGETQRQYTIMADTVAAKLKVAGNNLMAFFAEVGNGSLGPIGNVLDFVSNGLATLTNNLDKNATIFGSIKLPFTNGELIGFVGLLASAAAGFLALGSAVMKFKQAGAALGMYRGQVVGAGAAMGTFTGVAKRATTSTTMLGRAGAATGRMLGTAASVAMGPWGILAGLLAVTVGTLIDQTRAVSTSSSVLAEDLAALGDSAQGLSKLNNITIGGVFGQESKPFADGYKSLTEMKEAVATTYSEIHKTMQEAPITYGEGSLGVFAAEAGATHRASKQYEEAVGIIDEAFGEMVSAGNGPAAAKALTGFTKTSGELFDLLTSGNAETAKRYFDSAFEMNGLQLTQANLDKLSRGQLPEVQAAMLGLSEATNVTDAALESFDGGSEAYAALATKVEETSQAFMNMSEAAKAATDEAGNFNMSGFIETLNEQIAAQDAWAANLKVAGKIGGSEFIDALMELGPDSQAPLAAIVDEYVATGGKLSAEAQNWVDTIIAHNRRASGSVGQLGLDIGVAKDSIVSTLRDADMADALANMLSEDQLIAVSQAMEGMGLKSAQKFASGIIDGTTDVDTALANLFIDKEVKINADFDLTTAELSLGAIQALAAGTIATVELAALPYLAEGAIWDVVQLADGSTGFVQVDAETGKVTEAVAYAVDETTGTVAVMEISADDMQAMNKLAEAKANGDDTEAMMKINADPSQAEGVLASLSGRVTYSEHRIRVMEETTGRIARGLGGGGGRVIGESDGGVVSYYANGGVRENHVAQIAPAGSWRVWGEPETGGEAYIPLSRTKRKRSESILETVANRFGYGLTPHNTTHFANGGQYMAQSMSRERYRAHSVSNSAKVSFGDVTFTNGTQSDQFREFTRRIDRATRGL